MSAYFIPQVSLFNF